MHSHVVDVLALRMEADALRHGLVYMQRGLRFVELEVAQLQREALPDADACPEQRQPEDHSSYPYSSRALSRNAASSACLKGRCSASEGSGIPMRRSTVLFAALTTVLVCTSEKAPTAPSGVSSRAEAAAPAYTAVDLGAPQSHVLSTDRDQRGGRGLRRMHGERE
jgi:hypothetical protein